MRGFSETEMKAIAVSLAAATVLAVLITVSVVLTGRQDTGTMTVTEDSVDIEGRSIDVTDLIVPEEFTLTGGERWYFSRDPLKKWSDDQVAEYWIDPAEIGLDIVGQRSQEALEEFFAEVP